MKTQFKDQNFIFGVLGIIIFLKLYVLTFVDVSEVNALLRWKYSFDNQSKATLSTWTRTINSNKIDTFKNQGIT
jgi:hypothetical protein